MGFQRSPACRGSVSAGDQNQPCGRHNSGKGQFFCLGIGFPGIFSLPHFVAKSFAFDEVTRSHVVEHAVFQDFRFDIVAHRAGGDISLFTLQFLLAVRRGLDMESIDPDPLALAMAASLLPAATSFPGRANRLFSRRICRVERFALFVCAGTWMETSAVRIAINRPVFVFMEFERIGLVLLLKKTLFRDRFGSSGCVLNEASDCHWFLQVCEPSFNGNG